MDCKMLVGSYVCSEQPGEFRWQPGSLTQVCFMILEDTLVALTGLLK